MEGELSSEVGLAGRLFKSCVDLFWALLQRLSLRGSEPKQLKSLRDEFGRFYFWGDGYYPYEGRLDEILLSSSRLRRRVLSVMVEIAQLLCSEKTGLLSLVHKSLQDRDLHSQVVELRTLTEIILESLDESASSDSDTDSEKGDFRDLLQDIIDHLRSRNQCLIDLSASLDRPAADADFAESKPTEPTSFKISGPAEIWTRKVVDSFPNIAITLAERLGEANWQRYQRVSRKLKAMVPLDSNSEDDEVSDEDELADLHDFTETTKSSREQSSIFSSKAPQSSGIGTTATSVSQTGFENRFVRSRRRKKAQDVQSQATYTSVLTNDQGERGWLRIPTLPKDALLGKAFQCTVCGEKQKDIMSRTDWKRHVFTDLAPYICTFADCKLGLASFATRKSWADHEFSIHRVSRLWSCKDCGSEFSNREKYRDHATWNHSPVFTRGQLELQVKSAEKHIGAVLNDKCPFCFEAPGSKVRTFSMHVAKHMEEIALAVLPRDTEFEDDRMSLSSNGSASSQSASVAAKGHRLLNQEPQTTFNGTDVLSSLGSILGDETSQEQEPQISSAAEAAIASSLEALRENRWLQKQEPETTSAPAIASALGTFEGKRHATLDDLNFLYTIGRGTSYKTLLAEGRISKRLYAVKIIKKDCAIENDEVAQIKAEKDALLLAAQHKNPFIVQIRSTFQTETRVYFVFDHMSGGNLFFHVQTGQFGIKRAQFYAAQVVLALEFLHKYGVIHRNLKLDNVLLGKDGYIKLTDLEYCKLGMLSWKRKTSTFCGTPEYMAPEILLDKPYGFEVDWWAFGVILYQMLLQQSPFRGEDEDEIYDAILSDEPLYPVNMQHDCVIILQKLLLREPTSRLGTGPNGAADVKSQTFFSNISWENIFYKTVEPRFVPDLKSPTDVRYFETELTSKTPVLTPVQSVLTQAMQEEFRGFSHMGVH